MAERDRELPVQFFTIVLNGDVPEVRAGTILGHEAVGTVVEVGSAVSTLIPGDRVLASCISACGTCRY